MRKQEMPGSDPDVNDLLQRTSAGDAGAAAQLFALVYDQLRAIAQSHLTGKSGYTVQATALVNEAYIKIVGKYKGDLRSKEHFLAIGGKAIRQVLADHEKRRRRKKRGGNAPAVSLDGRDLAKPGTPIDIVSLNDALTKLEAFDERASQVVEMHFFGDLGYSTIAELLGVSERTAKKDWEFARSWLQRELRSGG